MELRSCFHLHFIQAIEGGSVSKTINVFRGRPALKFKKMNDIYESEDTTNQDSRQIISPKAEFEELQIVPALADRRCTIDGDEIKVESEIEMLESTHSGDSSGVKCESDDVEFLDLTLKQLKDGCKAKKGKCSGRKGMSTYHASPSSGRHFSIKPEEVESDAMDLETLSFWRHRLSKKKGRQQDVSPSSHAPITVKTEETSSEDFIFQSSGNSAGNEVDTNEQGNSDGQSIITNAVQSSSGLQEPMDSSDLVSDVQLTGSKMVTIPSEKLLDPEYSLPQTDTSIISVQDQVTAENQTATCLSNEPRYCVPSDLVSDVQLTGYEMVKIPCEELDDPEYSLPQTDTSIISVQVQEMGENQTVTCLSNEPQYCVPSDDICEHIKLPDPTSTTMVRASTEEATSPTTANEAQCCVNEESYEHVEQLEPTSTSDVKASNEGYMMATTNDEANYNHSDLTLPDMSEVSTLGIIEGSTRTVSPSKDQNSNIHVSSQCLNAMLASEKTDTTNHIQVPNLSNDNIGNEHDSFLSMNGTIDIPFQYDESAASSPVKSCIPLPNSNLCSSPGECLVSCSDDSMITENRQSPISPLTEFTINYIPVNNSPIQESTTSTDAEDFHNTKIQHPPERLFSTRKTISPTSQKRLWRAMEFAEFDDEQYYKYTRKLCYMKPNDIKNGRSGGANCIRRDEINISPKPVFRKLNNDTNSSQQKGILKGFSRAVPQSNTSITSVRSCSESAISFSQQQMHDIESVATKLARELKSLKDIVEETLNSNINSMISLKYSADEMRDAVQQATRAEESSRKWLSMMARDCNRFCKIMKLSEKHEDSSESAVCKGKRKIVFADEAGGKLCEVKTFKNNPAPFAE